MILMIPTVLKGLLRACGMIRRATKELRPAFGFRGQDDDAYYVASKQVRSCHHGQWLASLTIRFSNRILCPGRSLALLLIPALPQLTDSTLAGSVVSFTIRGGKRGSPPPQVGSARPVDGANENV